MTTKFCAPGIYLLVGMLLLGCAKEAPTPPENNSTTYTNMKVGPATPLVSGTLKPGGHLIVGPEGRTLGLEGMQLMLEADTAYTIPVTLTARAIESHELGDLFNPVSALIHIETGTIGHINGIYRLQIPLSSILTEDELAMGFYYDPLSGSLEGIPVLDGGSNFLELGTSHFSEVVVSKVKTARLPDYIYSGFEPVRDGWPFQNRGSFQQPRGICVGMSVSAIYAYLQEGGSLVNADNASIPGWKTPDFWYDDIYGIYFSTLIQNYYGWEINNTWRKLGLETKVSDLTKYRLIAYGMAISGQPQLIEIWTADRKVGHAMVVYGVENKSLLVYDPNYPNDASRVISFNTANGKFNPYASAANAEEIARGEGYQFPNIHPIVVSGLFDFNKIKKLWDTYYKKQVIASPYKHDQLEILFHEADDGEGLYKPDAQGNILIPPGYYELGLAGFDFEPYAVVGEDLQPIPENITYYFTEKDDGSHLGLYVTKPVQDAGKTYNSWWGFRWFTLRIESPPEHNYSLLVTNCQLQCDVRDGKNNGYPGYVDVRYQGGDLPVVWTGNQFSAEKTLTEGTAKYIFQYEGEISSDEKQLKWFHALKKTQFTNSGKEELFIDELSIGNIPWTATNLGLEIALTGTTVCNYVQNANHTYTVTPDPDKASETMTRYYCGDNSVISLILKK